MQLSNILDSSLSKLIPEIPTTGSLSSALKVSQFSELQITTGKETEMLQHYFRKSEMSPVSMDKVGGTCWFAYAVGPLTVE